MLEFVQPDGVGLSVIAPSASAGSLGTLSASGSGVGLGGGSAGPGTPGTTSRAVGRLSAAWRALRGGVGAAVTIAPGAPGGIGSSPLSSRNLVASPTASSPPTSALGGGGRGVATEGASPASESLTTGSGSPAAGQGAGMGSRPVALALSFDSNSTPRRLDGLADVGAAGRALVPASGLLEGSSTPADGVGASGTVAMGVASLQPMASVTAQGQLPGTEVAASGAVPGATAAASAELEGPSPFRPKPSDGRRALRGVRAWESLGTLPGPTQEDRGHDDDAG